jgi:hypothetical protein
MIRKLRDGTERQIEEFYCGLFLKDAPELLVAGGKLKDRQRWSSEDNDNHITPSPIKVRKKAIRWAERSNTYQSP